MCSQSWCFKWRPSFQRWDPAQQELCGHPPSLLWLLTSCSFSLLKSLWSLYKFKSAFPLQNNSSGSLTRDGWHIDVYILLICKMRTASPIEPGKCYENQNWKLHIFQLSRTEVTWTCLAWKFSNGIIQKWATSTVTQNCRSKQQDWENGINQILNMKLIPSKINTKTPTLQHIV